MPFYRRYTFMNMIITKRNVLDQLSEFRREVFNYITFTSIAYIDSPFV